MPNVLIVGVGSGSWQIRGVQLGQAIGARVTGTPTADDWQWADLCVCVKRALSAFAADARRYHVPIIWDALDFWTQPEHNSWPESEVAASARMNMEIYGVQEVIGATQAMADELDGVYLPHHSRPKLSPDGVGVRQSCAVVAYEGTPKYLGSWRVALENVCVKYGLTFLVNPHDLREADIVVAFRGEKWDGEICRRWKSGVKYVNAIAAGRPFITQPSAAFDEIGGPGVVIDRPDDLEAAIVGLAPAAVRREALTQCRAKADAYALRAVAKQYRQILTDVGRKVAA